MSWDFTRALTNLNKLLKTATKESFLLTPKSKNKKIVTLSLCNLFLLLNYFLSRVKSTKMNANHFSEEDPDFCQRLHAAHSPS